MKNRKNKQKKQDNNMADLRTNLPTTALNTNGLNTPITIQRQAE